MGYRDDSLLAMVPQRGIGFLHLWTWRMGGAVGHPTFRMEPLEATPQVSRNRRKDGFHGSTCLAWPSTVRAAPKNYHESNHGKTRKSNLLGGLNPALLVWPNHGGSEAFSWQF